MVKMKLKPFITAVDDYHEFNSIVGHFYNAGFENVKYIECGVFPSDYVDGNYAEYHAVFYQSKQTKEVKDLVKLCKKLEEEFENSETFK